MHDGTQQAEARVKIPGKFELVIFESPPKLAADLFILRRRFGKPGGLVESQNVAIELEGFEGAIRVVINRDSDHAVVGEFVKGASLLSVSVAGLLMQNNTFEVEFGSLPAGAGELKLVIEE